MTREWLWTVGALGIDWQAIYHPYYSPDGERLAWGTAEGTVLVADLEEVRRRLESLEAAHSKPNTKSRWDGGKGPAEAGSRRRKRHILVPGTATDNRPRFHWLSVPESLPTRTVPASPGAGKAAWPYADAIALDRHPLTALLSFQRVAGWRS